MKIKKFSNIEELEDFFEEEELEEQQRKTKKKSKEKPNENHFS